MLLLLVTCFPGFHFVLHLFFAVMGTMVVMAAIRQVIVDSKDLAKAIDSFVSR